MASSEECVIAAVEGGGQTFVAALVKARTIVERYVFKTTTPSETLPAVTKWLEERRGTFRAIGIGCFGPVDLHRQSPSYGFITTTPKTGWQMADVVGPFKVFGVPIGFDTDANAGATVHSTADATSIAYITAGTGVGVGIMNSGEPIHGLLHPEMGHIYVPRAPDETLTEGVCVYHKCCLEGYTCSAAIARRCGVEQSDLQTLSDDDPCWNIVAHYFAQMCTTLILTVSPQKIAIGGGIIRRKVLLPLIRQKCFAMLNGYVKMAQILEHIDEYIIYSPYEENAGILGAAEIGLIELKRHLHNSH